MLSHYPDEDAKALIRDVQLAAIDVNKVVDEIVRGNDVGRSRFEVMDHLLQDLMDFQEKRRPLWRRVFGGTWFNYEKAPIIERVTKCRENLFLLAHLEQTDVD